VVGLLLLSLLRTAVPLTALLCTGDPDEVASLRAHLTMARLERGSAVECSGPAGAPRLRFVERGARVFAVLELPGQPTRAREVPWARGAGTALAEVRGAGALSGLAVIFEGLLGEARDDAVLRATSPRRSRRSAAPAVALARSSTDAPDAPSSKTSSRAPSASSSTVATASASVPAGAPAPSPAPRAPLAPEPGEEVLDGRSAPWTLALWLETGGRFRTPSAWGASVALGLTLGPLFLRAGAEPDLDFVYRDRPLALSSFTAAAGLQLELAADLRGHLGAELVVHRLYERAADRVTTTADVALLAGATLLVVRAAPLSGGLRLEGQWAPGARALVVTGSAPTALSDLGLRAAIVFFWAP
jgi:hypothetical protein